MLTRWRVAWTPVGAVANSSAPCMPTAGEARESSARSIVTRTVTRCSGQAAKTTCGPVSSCSAMLARPRDRGIFASSRTPSSRVKSAVSGGLEAVEVMKVAFDRRRRTIVELLNGIPGVVCPEPEGAFYAYPSVEGVLGRKLRGRVPTTSAELAEVILDEAEVAVVPGEAFGAPGYLRLSYALSDDDLREGIGRIATLLAE